MDVFYMILTPFSFLLNVLNDTFNNYGLAIISFAVVVKLFLFPFAIKGKRSMIQMNLLSGQMQNLQKQYGKDRERYNIEIQNLYAREKVNPMSGCLWSMVPMFVLIPLYAIIRQPLKYLMGLNETQIIEIANRLNWDSVAVSMGWTTQQVVDKALGASASGAGDLISGFANSGFDQLYLASLINDSTLPSLQGIATEAGRIFAINFNFFGLNMAALPNWRVWENYSLDNVGLVVLVLISAVTGFFFSLISMRTNRMNSTTQNEAAERTSRTMMYTMPLMSLWIGFIMPAGLCVYWIANNLLSMIQEFVAGKILKKDYEAARIAAEERAQREKEEEKHRKVQAAEERARRLEEEKKNRGKKKPEKKKEEAPPSGINKTDSQVGIRAYARGRSYDPNRFGGVTEYRAGPISEAALEEDRWAKGQVEEAAPDVEEVPTEETLQTALPPALETKELDAPAQEEEEPEETEELEEFEELEEEIDEDDDDQEGVR